MVTKLSKTFPFNIFLSFTVSEILRHASSKWSIVYKYLNTFLITVENLLAPHLKINSTKTNKKALIFSVLISISNVYPFELLLPGYIWYMITHYLLSRPPPPLRYNTFYYKPFTLFTQFVTEIH